MLNYGVSQLLGPKGAQKNRPAVFHVFLRAIVDRDVNVIE